MEEKIAEDIGEEIIKQLTSLILYLENNLKEKRNEKEFPITSSA